MQKLFLQEIWRNSPENAYHRKNFKVIHRWKWLEVLVFFKIFS
jgi:hypothetical protein